MTSTRNPEAAAALTATLGLAAAAWVVAVRQMNGMDMGVATELGSFAFFVTLWVSMMAAMMLPGAVPAVLRHARANGRVRAVPLCVVRGIGCHERYLDVRDRRPRPRPEAPAAQSRHRHAAGAGDRRT